MAVVQVWAIVLIIYGVSAEMIYPLDMAPESVDDMYKGCSNEMKPVVNKYLKDELEKDANFTKAWNIAEEEYEKRIGQKKKKTGIQKLLQKVKQILKPAQMKPLEKELFKAVYVYTNNNPPIYQGFNEAVRTQKSEYKTTFRYHALHFFLTRAIQTLNAGKTCQTTYRRVNSSFRRDVLNQMFRFGSFTSSSKEEYPAEFFGKKSCFNITTCFGADIEQYSKFGKQEKEVLIPPYEKFKVKKIITGTQANKDKKCEVIYEMKSKGKSSSSNCALFLK